MVSDDALM